MQSELDAPQEYDRAVVRLHDMYALLIVQHHSQE